MTDFDPNDPEQLARYNEAMRAAEEAWNAYLRFTLCVKCTLQNLIAMIEGIAAAKNTEIMGIDWINENSMKPDQIAEPPLQRDGIYRECESCRKEGQG